RVLLHRALLDVRLIAQSRKGDRTFVLRGPVPFSGHGTRGHFMRPIFVALLAAAALAPAARAGDLRNFDGAALHPIQFVDPAEGFAVGDEGVVWHTIDGGKTWERQPTGVRASLRSLFFLNPYVGWVVGREELPDGSSTGVVLYTKDGGLNFKRLLPNSVPGLSGVRFSV